MADEKLQIIIEGEDKASKPLGGIRNALGEIAKTALGFLSAKIFENLGKAAVSFAKDFVDEASEAQAVTTQLNAVLASTKGVAGVTADAAQDLASSLARVTRFEDDTILGAENLLLTFTKIGSEIFPQATETVLNMSTALGQDLKASATMLGKALQDPVTGVSALRRVGISFSEDQQNVIAALVETGDVAAAQKLILAELETQFGNSARAAGQTFPGQLEILKNMLGDVKETLGTAILPALQGFAQAAIDALGSPQVQAGIDAIAAGIGTMAEKAAAFAADVLPGLAAGLTDLVNAFLSWAQGDTNTFLELLWNGLYQVGEAVGLTDEQMRPFLDWLTEAAKTVADAWQNTFKPALAAVWGYIQENILPIFGNVSDWLRAKIPEAIGIAKQFWEERLKPALVTVWRYIEQNILPIFARVKSWLQETIPQAIAVAKSWFETKLKPALVTVWEYIDQNILPVFTSVRDWLETNIPTAIEALKGFVDEQLVPAFRDIKKVLSEETNPELDTLAGKLAALGKQMAEEQVGQVGEMITKFGELYDALHDLSEIVNDIIDLVFDLKQEVGETESQGLMGVLKSWLGILQDLFSPIDDINRALDGAIGFVNALKDAASGLYNWLKEHEFNFRINLPKLPDWAIPGSPTPFEIGLRGIADAMEELNRVSLPRMQQAFATPAVPQSQTITNHNYYLTTTARYEDPRTTSQHLERLRLLTQGGTA